MGAAMVFALHSGAQAQLSLSINLGRQPAWGPTGYNHVDYYYLPDIESYYDVSTGQYIYQNNGQWIFANNLPPRYRGYDLYSGYKVVVNRPKPYLSFNRDRASYGRYRNWNGAHQPMLRESRNMGGNMNHGGMNHGGGMNPGGNGNGMNHGNMNPGGNGNNMNHGGNGMNRGNMNQGGGNGNGMNRGGMNQGGQQQGQNHPQGQGGQPQNNGGGGGHDDHGHHD